MTIIEHAVATPPPGRMQRRVAGLLFAGLLQVGLIYALIVGLDIKVAPIIDDYYPWRVIVDPIKPITPPPVPESYKPTRVDPVTPRIVISENGGGDKSTALTPTGGGTTAGPVVYAAQGIMSTHIKPPYPRLSMILGEQGTVVLRLTISTRGIVQDAVIVRSSGYENLDRAARAWVIQQWRYRAATIGGQPVASTADVAVRFDLRQAG
jgi:periplasmic protein TonB